MGTIRKGTYKFLDTINLTTFTTQATTYELNFKVYDAAGTLLNSYEGMVATDTALSYSHIWEGYYFMNSVQWEQTWSVTDDQTTWVNTLVSDEMVSNNKSVAKYKSVNQRTQEQTTVTYSVEVDKDTGTLSGDTNHNNASTIIGEGSQQYNYKVYDDTNKWSTKSTNYQTIVIESDQTVDNTFADWFSEYTTTKVAVSSYQFKDTVSLPDEIIQTLNFVSYKTDYISFRATSNGIWYKTSGGSEIQVYNETSKWNTDTKHRKCITISTEQDVSTLFNDWLLDNATKYDRVKLASPDLSHTTSVTGFVLEYKNMDTESAVYAMLNGALMSSEALAPNLTFSKSYTWEDNVKTYTFTAYAKSIDDDLYDDSDEVTYVVAKDYLNEPIVTATDIDDNTTKLTIKNSNDLAVSYYINNVLQGTLASGATTTYNYTWGDGETSKIFTILFKDQTGNYGDSSETITVSHLIKLPAPLLTLKANTNESYTFTFKNTSSEYSVQPAFNGTFQGNALQPNASRDYTYSWGTSDTSITITAWSMTIDSTKYKDSDTRTLTITRTQGDGYSLQIDYNGSSYLFASGSGQVYTLPPATTTELGGIIVGDNLTIAEDGTLSANASYTLPVASANTLGGIKVGNNLSITTAGVLSATDTIYTLPKATTTTLGGVIIGDNLTIDSTGKISAVQGTYTLPIAGATTLGGVKIGENLTISQDGTLKAITGSYTLPVATSSALGGVKIGYTTTNKNYAVQLDTNNKMYVNVPWTDTTYTIATISDNGLMSSSDKIKLNGIATNANNYTLPTATSSTLGGVKVGSRLSIADSVLSANKQITYEIDDTNLEITLTIVE